MPSTNQQTALLIFCSYAAEDEVHRRAFEKSLASLKRAGLVDIWSNQQIKAGENIELAIESALRSAHIIVLLISNSFIASDNCWDNEMTYALKRHMRQEVRIIPILVGSCLWENTPLASLKPLPSNAKPVTSWNIQDDAWASIAGDINEAIKVIQIEELKRNTPISIRETPNEQEKLIIKRILEKLEKFSNSLPSIEFTIDELLNLGDARFVSGDIDEAIRLYHKAIQVSPENASSWQKLGFALEVGHGRYKEALRYYNVSLALDPAQTETHIDRSYVLRQLGQFTDSIDAATAALFLDMGNARALYNRACSYARSGNKLEALMNLNAAIVLNPNRYRSMAAWDRDFQTLGAMPEFIRLIEN